MKDNAPDETQQHDDLESDRLDRQPPGARSFSTVREARDAVEALLSSLDPRSAPTGP